MRTLRHAIVSVHLLILIVASKPQPDTLLRQVRSPNAVSATAAELLARCFLATAPGSFCQNNLKISLLAADPSLDKRSWVFRQVVVEFAFGVGLVDLLNQQRQFVVGAYDCLQVANVRLRGVEARQLVQKRIWHGHTDVIDRWPAWFLLLGFLVF